MRLVASRPLLIASGLSLLSACVPQDPPRRDVGPRDARPRVDANTDAGEFFEWDDASAPDAGPLPPPYFEESAVSAGLGATHGPVRNAPDCLFDDPAMPGPGDHCDAEWALAGAAVGDANGDGHQDLFVTRIDGPASLYQNDGAGHFTDVTAARGLTIDEPTAGAGFGDIDLDGDLDLFVSVIGGLQHYLFLNEGATFRDVAVARGAALTSALPLLGSIVTFGDYDQDGDLDLYVGEWRNRTIVHDGPPMARLLRNRGPAMPGFFEDVTIAAGVSMEDAWMGVTGRGVYIYAVGMFDLDGDGNTDLAINGDFRTSRLFWGRGDGTFVDGTRAARVGTEMTAMGSTFTDIDDDGDLDWFVSSTFRTLGPDWGNRLFRNDGARVFTDITTESGVLDSGWPWGSAFFDYDNDRDADLAVTNGWYQPPFFDDPSRLYRNEANGTFVDVAGFTGMSDSGQGRSMVVFDPDEDGDLDLFVARYGAPPHYYRNLRGTESAWLRVQVRDAVEGLGARITIRETATSTPRIVVIGQSTQYLGQSERIAHFGLGTFTGTIAEVRAELIDGTVLIERNVPIRQVLQLSVP